MNPIEIRLGESYEPICCILHNIVDRRLVVSCGTRIIVMDSREGVAVEKMITTDDNRWGKCILFLIFFLIA